MPAQGEGAAAGRQQQDSRESLLAGRVFFDLLTVHLYFLEVNATGVADPIAVDVVSPHGRRGDLAVHTLATVPCG